MTYSGLQALAFSAGGDGGSGLLEQKESRSARDRATPFYLIDAVGPIR